MKAINQNPEQLQLQASLSQCWTIITRLGSNTGIHGRVLKEKPLLTKKEQKGSSDIFQKKHLDDPQDFDENVMWLDDMKVELF